MKIKDILAKVAKGEKLSDEETKFLSEYDPDKAINDAAAAARRKAEQDAADSKKAQDALAQQLKDLESKLAETSKGKMSDAEKAAADQADLRKQLADLSAKFAAKETETKQLARQAKVDAVIRASGIQFVKEVDASILTGALAGALKDVADDQLDKTDVVTPILDGFKAKNKAVIVDTSGSGAGTDPARRVEVGVGGGKPIDKMSADERAKDLQARGII